MAAIYSTKTGDTITEGLQGYKTCNEAFATAQEIAARRKETVILDDEDGEWLVGPRGGLRRFTRGLKRKYGFSDEARCR